MAGMLCAVHALVDCDDCDHTFKRRQEWFAQLIGLMLCKVTTLQVM